jgi:hypothetical protein
MLAATLLGGCAVAPIAVAPTSAEYRTRVLDAVRTRAVAGDWLVIRGRHATDNLVATLTNMPLSHAAVFDPELDQVIEAEGVGVHASTLETFVDKSERLLIVHPVWSEPKGSTAAVLRARALVGRDYDYLGLLGINATTRYYCTELAVSIYHPAEKPKNPIPAVIAPGQLYHWGTIVYDSGPSETAR